MAMRSVSGAGEWMEAQEGRRAAAGAGVVMDGPPGQWTDEVTQLRAEIERLEKLLSQMNARVVFEMEHDINESLYDDPPENIDRSPVSWWRSG
jgi:hypothetical protein